MPILQCSYEFPRPPRPNDEKRLVPPPVVPRCCWPGTTGIAAGCRGGRRRASAPIRTACGYRRSCCSRPASKPSGPISRNFWRAGPMWHRSAAPRSTRCCGCGPGSAIIRGRGTCTLARSRWYAITAASFLIPRMACARCRGSGPIPRRRSRRSPSTSGPCRSTAISSAWCRGFTPSRSRCRRPSR